MRADMSDVVAQGALQRLSEELAGRYGKKVLIFLDEYDTPMQEAYLHGYWVNLLDLSVDCSILHLRATFYGAGNHDRNYSCFQGIGVF